MLSVYLDWNVINRIEKKEGPEYSDIEKLILNREIITPYSNAHINDLLRGYEKNKEYIEGHLSIIEKLTNNLCIVQYWGEKSVKWHFRSIHNFFNSSLEEPCSYANSFSSLLDFLKDDYPEIEFLWDAQLSILKNQKLPLEFKDVYKIAPVFNLIFPTSKSELNMLALCEDLLSFANNVKKDYSLYKAMRNFLNQSRIKFKEQPKIFRKIDKVMAEVPSHLVYDQVWEDYLEKNSTKENPLYQRLTTTYFKIDYRGIKSDTKFANLVDDSIHTFYGAHCDYFLTLDDRCLYKAVEAYRELGIKTMVLNPSEFLQIYKLIR